MDEKLERYSIEIFKLHFLRSEIKKDIDHNIFMRIKAPIKLEK